MCFLGVFVIPPLTWGPQCVGLVRNGTPPPSVNIVCSVSSSVSPRDVYLAFGLIKGFIPVFQLVLEKPVGVAACLRQSINTAPYK